MIDLTKKTDQIKVLRNDKYRLLEGYCTEYLFMKDILEEKKSKKLVEQSSTGWWVAKGDDRGYTFFKLANDQLKDSDIKVFEKLIKEKIRCFYVILRNKRDLLFLDINKEIESIKNGSYKNKLLSQREFQEVLAIKPVNNPLNVVESAKIPMRQERAIEFIKKNGLLEKVAFERYFANNFLTVYFNRGIINLDCIIVIDDKYSVCEIKYKYPFKRGKNYYFGINYGQAQIFQFLLNKDLNIYHYILLNPTNNKDVSVIDILHNKDNLAKAKWIFSKIEKEDFSSNYEVAPSDTQIEARTQQKHYNIRTSKFYLRKKLSQRFYIVK